MNQRFPSILESQSAGRLLYAYLGLICDEQHQCDWPPLAATPYPAAPDFPLFRGQNKPLYASL